MTGMPPKPDLVFHTPLLDENEHLAFNVQLSPSKHEQYLPSTSSAPIIEDWVSDSEEEDIPQVTTDVPSLAQSPELVKTPRYSGLISPPPMSVAPHVPASITTAARTVRAVKPKFSKARPNITPYVVSKSKSPFRKPFIRHTSPKPSISPLRVNAGNPFAVSAARVNAAKLSALSAARVNAAKLFAVSAARINAVKPFAVTAVQHNHTKKGNPQQALKDKGVIDSGCSRHMIRNMSYLYDFEELNGGYVAFGGNPKGGKITGK
nr:ribonuclease H-like domain-containing protein [Tanacetum cinerariifolium]